ncbi:MAG: rhomboid family intramembrane serine protease [Chlamydiia bacterium]
MVRFFLLLMSAIFIVDTFQFFQFMEGASTYVQSIAPLTPIKTYLMFQDFPLDRELFDLLMTQKMASSIDALTPQTQEILNRILQDGRQLGTMNLSFQDLSIVQGQVYRLVTPALLHANILHILFNLLWFFVLGRMIEMRAGPLKLGLIFILVAIITNCAQFFASGPLFLGVSGVVCGLAGFIYVRHKRAPWEGYPLSRSGVMLLFFYILFLTLIELFSKVVFYVSGSTVIIPIANTAHLVGAACGGLLGLNRWFRCST